MAQNPAGLCLWPMEDPPIEPILFKINPYFQTLRYTCGARYMGHSHHILPW